MEPAASNRRLQSAVEPTSAAGACSQHRSMPAAFHGKTLPKAQKRTDGLLESILLGYVHFLYLESAGEVLLQQTLQKTKCRGTKSLKALQDAISRETDVPPETLLTSRTVLPKTKSTRPSLKTLLKT